MFEVIAPAPPDPILGLTEAFHADTNPRKVNLTVGVYQDDAGHCPILESVKRAEVELLQSENTKTYLGIGGMPDFGRDVRKLIFGHEAEALADRAVTVQTPGGTAALRVAADLVAKNFPSARAWCSKPTWANHPNIFRAAGVEVEQYPYADAEATGLDLEAMLEGLRQVPAGHLVCLHACCHNPTGIDLDESAWKLVAAIARERKWIPLLDFAYQGFGSGVEEDAIGVRTLISEGLDLLVASSYSKNFGLYGERTGALTAVASTPESAAATLSQLKVCIRANYSNPPKHGAAIVAQVLANGELKQIWEREVESMRYRIRDLRQQFVEHMKPLSNRDFGFLMHQRGMFSFSGLTPLQVDRLKQEYSIYIVGSGRINIAGLNSQNLEYVCRSVAAVIDD